MGSKAENKTVTKVISKMEGTSKDEENLDEILSKVKKIDDTCDFKMCKQKTTLMGQSCELCKSRFCMKHILAESHGCGGAVKKKEREEFLHPKVDTRKMQHQVDHDKAKKNLSSKLKQMELERRAKPTGNEIKKKK